MRELTLGARASQDAGSRNLGSTFLIHPVQHMTLKHEDLARSIVLRDHEAEEVPHDIFLNSNRAEELRNDIDAINNRLEAENEFWQTGINEAEASRIVLGILWMSVFQCNELIVSARKSENFGHNNHKRGTKQRDCRWKGVDLPCQELFSLIPTDYGFCCSFNHDSLDAMLRNSNYVSKVMDVDERYGSK